MEPINYFSIIHKYIPPDSWTYSIYLPHVCLVTAKAINIGRRLGLTDEQLQFIEEASMLHDIGIVKVERYCLHGESTLPYLCHAPQGRTILETEGLPGHALVAERHIGVGISKAEIIANQLPLPHRDLIPETLEEKIISWADLFFSKTPHKLWKEHSLKKVGKKVAQYGERQQQAFQDWAALFEMC